MNKSCAKITLYNMATIIEIIVLLYSSAMPYVNADPLKYIPTTQKNVTGTSGNLVTLRFAVGETAILDCGHLSEGNSEEMKVAWFDENMQEIKNGTRISIDSNDRKDFKHETYSVLTLTVSNLTKDDNKTYVCKMNSNEVQRIVIDLKKQDTWYGFEGIGMSGWRNINQSAPVWHKHNVLDSVIQERTKGPGYDHTYSSLKSVTGHFIDLDVEHQNKTTKSVATIISPQYSKTTSQSCLHFYYVLDGDGIAQLEVLLKINTSTSTLISELKDKTKIWKHVQKTIDVQKKEFNIMFTATVCTQETCTTGVVAIDDIAFTNGACESNETPVVPKTTANKSTQPPKKVPTITTSIVPTQTTTSTSISPTVPNKSINTTLSKVITTPTKQSSSTGTITHFTTTTPTSTNAVSSTITKVTTTTMKQTTTSSNKTTTTASPVTTVKSSTSQLPSSTTEIHSNITTPSEKVPANHGVSRAVKIGRGVVAGIVIIVLLGVVIFAVLIYKGRKRRLRKSKYLNFGSASYSREHLPTNEFHLESPLTMSSMGYTVLA